MGSLCSSGGHFNPAVSLTVYLCGGIKLLLGVAYILAQVLGGMIGAGLAKVRSVDQVETISSRSLWFPAGVSVLSGGVPSWCLCCLSWWSPAAQHQRVAQMHRGRGADDPNPHHGGVHGGREQPNPLTSGSLLHWPHRDGQHICRVRSSSPPGGVGQDPRATHTLLITYLIDVWSFFRYLSKTDIWFKAHTPAKSEWWVNFIIGWV